MQCTSANRLAVNPNKCIFMTFSRSPSVPMAPYKMNDCILERADSIRDLGVIMDPTMSFGIQIQSVVNKCLRTLEFIKNVSRDLRVASTLVKLYKSVLLPLLTYCSPRWVNNSPLRVTGGSNSMLRK